ncbi:MAG: hypothetical protein J0M15_15395 [Deltaproteobacteria bacterium]|nr:hypothetical protein [Deltaproteobacteria bacterium]
MNHINKLIFLLIIFSFYSFADCLFLGLKGNIEYKFICEGKEISVNCLEDKERDECEADINVEIKKYNVQFINSKISSINKLSYQDKTHKICDLDHGKNISCETIDDCKNGIHSDRFFEETEQVAHQESCSKNKFEIAQKYILSDQLVSQWTDKFEIENKINNSCGQLEDKEKRYLKNFLKKFVNSDYLRKSCFADIKNRENKAISESSKIRIADKVSLSLINFIDNDLKNCDGLMNHFFEESKLNMNQFLCMKIQNVLPIKNINCVNGRADGRYANKDTLIASNKDSGAEVARADTSGLENQTPKLIPKPAEMSDPILVKGTLAKIDEMLEKNSGIVTPEVAASAGDMFNAGVYKRTQEAIDYLDEKFFAGEHKENGNQNHDTSGNDSSQNNGSRAPASKLFGKKERNSRPPSSSNKIAGSSGDDSISIAPGGVKAGLAGGESGDAVAASTAVNGGRAVNILDGKNKVAGRLSIDNQNGKQTGGVPPGTNPESTFAAGSGAGSGGLQVGSAGLTRLGGNVGSGSVIGKGAASGLGPASTTSQKNTEVRPLTAKDKKELNQFVNALTRIDNVKDLETVLRYGQNFPQLDYLIKNTFVQNQSPGGNSRGPASKFTDRVGGARTDVDPIVEKAQKELVGRLKEYNVKVFDGRTGNTVFDPTKGRDSDVAGRAAKPKNTSNTDSSDETGDTSSVGPSYIVRIDDKGVRFSKPLRGTSKNK